MSTIQTFQCVILPILLLANITVAVNLVFSFEKLGIEIKFEKEGRACLYCKYWALSVIKKIFPRFWLTFRDFHDKLCCMIGAVGYFLLTLLLNQLSIMCCMGTQKKSFVVSSQLPDVMERNFYLSCLGKWEFNHNVKVWSTGQWETVPVGKPFPPLVSLVMVHVPHVAELYSVNWALWSVWRNSESELVRFSLNLKLIY